VEEQFYLLWPALLLFSRTRHTALRLSLAVFAASVIFCSIVWGLPVADLVAGHVFDNFLLTHAGALALGAALALVSRGSKAAEVSRYAAAAFAAGVLLYCGTSWFCGTFLLAPRAQFTLGLAGVCLASTALVQLVLRPGFAGGLFTLAPLRWMGRISYGFYVFHILLQPLFDKIATRVAPPAAGYSAYLTARFIAAFFITLAVAWLSFVFFEEPILELKRRFPMHSPLP
jgi:peptidoglycan/LPS O-acetylase OafA/YrhL